MRYALNVTPINGWETHFSQGAQSLALSADGSAYAFKPGIGNADLNLIINGRGLVGINGYGKGDMLLQAAYGIPVNPTHTGFITNKPDRIMRLLQEAPMRVPAREQALNVPRENRSA